jgi:CzcA family heavy metal efflux pump
VVVIDVRAESGSVLTALVRFSLHFRGAIIALAVVFTCYGLYRVTRAKFDVFPEFAPPQVSIRVEAAGLSPSQVEILITRPIENAILGVEGVESLLSHSMQGISAITVNFRSGSDIYRARQMVAERLASLPQPLPAGVTPFVSPLSSSTGTVMQIGLSSEKRSLMDLRTIADWTVKPRLLAVPGVAQVQVYGGEVKQLQVQLKTERLLQHNLSIEDVLAVAGKATGVRGAGFIENENQRIILQTEGQSLLPKQLARTVLVQRNGANLTLADVAAVTEAPAPPVGAAAIMGRPGVVMIINAQYGTNTLELTRSLDQALEELKPGMREEGVTLHSDLFRPAAFIHTAIHNVLTALEIGAVLVAIVLFLFLLNYRTAAISFTAIPLSLIAAIAVLEYLGYTLNTMTLGGLAIAIGEVVDDAVIDVENIFRRLRENRRRKDPHPVFKVVLGASIEVRGAVIFATLAVILVFLPIMTLSGVAGRLFAPLGIAYILAVIASLIVALTLTPALCLLLLGRPGAAAKIPPLMERLKKSYHGILLRVERHPSAVIGGVVLFVGAGLAVLPVLKGTFLPQFQEGDFIVHVTAIPGTSLEESLQLGSRVSRELLKLPYVRTISQKTGRAEEGSSIRGIGSSEIDAVLKSTAGGLARFSPPEVRKVLAQFPGVSYSVNTFLTERINETVAGYAAPVVINLFGNNLDVLDRKGEEVARVLAGIPGAADVRLQSMPSSPQMVIRLREKSLGRWGFRPLEILDALRTAYQGAIVGQIFEEARVFNVAVILNPLDRQDVSAIGKLPLRSPGGTYLRLEQIADIYQGPARYVILHNGGRRVQTITCGVTGRPVDSFVAEAREAIAAKTSLDPGTYIQFTGAAEAEARSERDLLIHSLVAAFGIVLLLSFILPGYRNMLLVLLNLPFALVGGVMAVLLTGGLLSLGSIVGFVTVFGITLRNSIMMVSHYQHLVSVEGMTWGPEAAYKGSSDRLTPILMTGLVTALGLLPLAVGSGAAGREIEGHMAIVILGGLISSTALNLLVLPTLALKYGRFEKKRDEEANAGALDKDL